VGNVRIRHSLNRGAIHKLFAGTHSGLAKNMAVRAVKVTAAAKMNLSKPPRRINTGYLRASIDWEFILIDGIPGFRVGTNAKYARFVHDGTGIYGPRKTPIRPKRARVLVFKPIGSSKKIFVKQVRGMRPNHFLADAIIAAKL